MYDWSHFQKRAFGVWLLVESAGKRKVSSFDASFGLGEGMVLSLLIKSARLIGICHIGLCSSVCLTRIYLIAGWS
jgi:hypothetical protein